MMATTRRQGPFARVAAHALLACSMMAGVALVAIAAEPAAGEAATGDEPPAELLRMHDDVVSAFVRSEGFGYARVTPMMRLMHGYRTSGTPAYYIRDVSLVGIARHDPPVVFDSPFQGFLHAQEAPSGGSVVLQPRREGRPLTDAERDAVRALERGTRLLVAADDAGQRVIGPIRARGDCLACHRGKRAGDLLGAFVYTLRPVPADAR